MKKVLLAFVALIALQSYGQTPKNVVIPTNAGELKRLCKSYQLIALQVELHKEMAHGDVVSASGCLNFIVGALSTILVMDVGYFPEMKLQVAKEKEAMPFQKMVKPFMDYIASHPAEEKDPAVTVLVLALIDEKILAPKHWTEK